MKERSIDRSAAPFDIEGTYSNKQTHSNLHTHSRFCDGAGTPDDYVRYALEKGFTDLGFSSHAPVPFNSKWNMTKQRADEYVAYIQQLKKEYAGRIRIYCGMEIDYLHGDDRGIFGRYGLDFTIGAVHFAGAAPGPFYDIEGGVGAFESALETFAGGDIRKLVTLYYSLVREMLRHERFDVLAHLDVIKKNNGDSRYFRESDTWYRKEIAETLDLAARQGAVVEVNTGGLARGRVDSVYPSEWILREMSKRDIPVTLGSDAHSPEQLDFYFEEATRLVRSAGYGRLYDYRDGTWVSRNIND
ncbi:MAG: histidinol-phosphatase [Clostridiaceae bacterium]|nr:histidinol-phosphatase [Clostridiaceae bacterium]